MGNRSESAPAPSTRDRMNSHHVAVIGAAVRSRCENLETDVSDSEATSAASRGDPVHFVSARF